MLEQLKALPQKVQILLIAVVAIAVVSIGINISQSNSHGNAVAAWDQARSDLTQRIEALEADKTALNTDVDQKATAIGELEAANADLTKVHGSLSALEVEAAASKNKLAGLTTRINQSESQLKVVGLRLATNQSSLMAAIKKRQRAAQDAEDMRVNRVRLAALQDDVHAEELRLQQVSRRLATEHISLQRALKRRQQIRDETNRLEAKSVTLAPLAEQADIKGRELKSLARRAAASQVGLSSAVNRQRQAQEALAALQVKSNYLAGVVAETGTKERRLKDLGLRLATTQASLKRSLDRQAQVAVETQALQAKLGGAERKLAPLQQELVSLGQKVEGLRDMVGEAQVQLGEPLIN